MTRVVRTTIVISLFIIMGVLIWYQGERLKVVEAFMHETLWGPDTTLTADEDQAK